MMVSGWSLIDHAQEEIMIRSKPILPIALAVFIASGLVAATSTSFAWIRTVMYTGPILSFSNTRTRIPFPSDSGATNVPAGNNATTLYVDFSTVGGSSPTNVILQACATAYNGAGGGCGSASIANYTQGGIYDISIGKWLGTGSVYDYFYIDVINNNAGALQPVGIGIVGN
jgi:membrane-bound metal-dependent hydrolase YbcI (DUF457 family)